ncbi:hypothetical protein V1279_001354 [Bradyrhizobium sp. AZCC 1610]|uniref:hypothetical protein n=1 Tax=Bradyrhizobium sp. AZCC 1610 TaxID=3117020 RepID=UPI002FF2502C
MWKAFIVLLALLLSAAAYAQERGRIKRPPPSLAEVERIASEMAMNDSLLQKGDIVVTDRGFFIFRGGPMAIHSSFRRCRILSLQAGVVDK